MAIKSHSIPCFPIMFRHRAGHELAKRRTETSFDGVKLVVDAAQDAGIKAQLELAT